MSTQYTETKGGIVVPLETKQRHPALTPEILPDWTPYYGCNHKRLPEVNSTYGGGFNYKSHLGKPLNDRLWQDILYRMHVTNLWILKDQEEWTIGRMRGAMTVYLDKDDNVEDIYYVP